MLLLTNGTIATMDPARPMAEAAVVDGAYFAYVGGRSAALFAHVGGPGRTPRTPPAAFPGEPGRLWISRAAL